MTKCFVLDTNVLLHDPLSLSAFEDNKIIIPIYVLEEIDNFKKEQSELGRNAREVSRKLDKLREQESLMKGVPFGKGLIQVRIAKQGIPEEYVAIDRGADTKILAVALEIHSEGKEQVVFVTKDINLRIRAAAMGIKAVDYTTEARDVSELYNGVYHEEVDASVIDTLFTGKEAPILEGDFKENSFGVLTAGKQSALVRFFPSGKIMKPIKGPQAWGIHARNKEQQFALELLLDDKIDLVTLIGQAGTGKTLLTIAAGLEKVAEEKEFHKLLVSRPIFPLGKDIGFLPGDVEEKLRPWMQPIYDNLELLMGIAEAKDGSRSTQEYFDLDMIQVEPLTYIRGRSIPRQFILVDEAQNLTPHEVKTIITRAGDDTKIVLTGDLGQIDNPYVDSTNNGLVHVVNRMSGLANVGHITLVKGERSSLAEQAAKYL